ncbi:MarR family transcriptional regulator, partial [Saccharomonospora saliphila]|uniref:MarR family transcriptional regulator n=1 Tax=Saccharomonospora saliphila TaxID=369829 RepID=UPI001E52AD04
MVEPRRPARGVQQHGHNLALVAGLVARHGPVSRAELARRCGLTKTTVTQLTGELVEGGLLRELGTSRAVGPGRPAHLLVLNASGPAGIGLQVEADHVAGCLVDLTGRVRDRAIRPGSSPFRPRTSCGRRARCPRSAPRSGPWPKSG